MNMTIQEIQSLFSKENHIYKITRDIDLQGGVLNLPAGSTLDFQGGGFSNGEITGNQSRLIGNIKVPKLSGTFYSWGTTDNRPNLSNTVGTNDVVGIIYFDTTLNKPLYWDGTKWTSSDGKTPTITSGTTDQRPTLTQNDKGATYFDTTINKYLYWDGTQWNELPKQSDQDTLRQIVYTNHIWTAVSVSPNVGFKGEQTSVTLNYSSGITGSTGLTPQYVVKKNGTTVQLASGSKETLTDSTTYAVTGSLGGVSKDNTAYFNAYYPIYTFASSDATIKALPGDATKYSTAVPAPNITVSTVLAANQYFCIAIPDGMKLSGAQTNSAAGSAPAKMVAMGDITITGKGTYHCYRSSMTQVAGTYSITYKG